MTQFEVKMSWAYTIQDFSSPASLSDISKGKVSKYTNISEVKVSKPEKNTMFPFLILDFKFPTFIFQFLTPITDFQLQSLNFRISISDFHFPISNFDF